jgi:hypothetical protein
MICWDRRHPLCWYCRGGVQSQWPPWQCGPYIWFLWRGWKNCGIECGVPGRYCVHLWPTCPDVLVLCAVGAFTGSPVSAAESTLGRWAVPWTSG